jgi:hypothetical protein
MQPIGAYITVLSREAARNQQPARVAKRDADPDPEPRPGIGQRVRKLFSARPRIAREPDFAASRTWLDGVVPRLTAYPSASLYR